MDTRIKLERDKHCYKILLEANCSWQVCAMKEMGGECYLMPFWSEGPTQDLIFWSFETHISLSSDLQHSQLCKKGTSVKSSSGQDCFQSYISKLQLTKIRQNMGLEKQHHGMHMYPKMIQNCHCTWERDNICVCKHTYHTIPYPTLPYRTIP